MEELYSTISLIRKKRDKQELSEKETKWLIDQYSHDLIPDYQMSAFMMAAFLNGLNASETAALTSSMLESGKKMDLSDIPAKKVDKHSTGGVGDKLSLILAPIVAACGAAVPMISGRGLGHTGGTLDKMESVPGFTVRLDSDRFKEVLKKHNLVMGGQSEDVAPADKRLYSLRDVTATVEYIPFIAASIMSKKLSEDLDGLTLDVKCGSGAFMKTEEDAIALGSKLVEIGEAFGVNTEAFVTNMNDPLGETIGNWLEMKESIDCLKGEGPEDVMVLSKLLAASMLVQAEVCADLDEGLALAQAKIDDGSALQKWIDLAQEQGADIAYLKGEKELKPCEISFEVKAENDGVIQSIDSFALGLASVGLGGGRASKEDVIDPMAGIKIFKKSGDTVKKGETLAIAYTNKARVQQQISKQILGAFVVGPADTERKPYVLYRIDKKGVVKADQLF